MDIIGSAEQWRCDSNYANVSAKVRYEANEDFPGSDPETGRIEERYG